MEIIRQQQPEIREVEILDFEKENNLELLAVEFPIGLQKVFNAKKYYAIFDKINLNKDMFYSGFYGTGDTVDEAIKDYCEKISFKTFSKVFGFIDVINMREIKVPKLIHTKLIGE
jgi:hypothetical protein